MNIKKKIEHKIYKILTSINIKKKYNYKIYDNENISDFQINGLITIAKLEKKNVYLLIKKIKKELINNKLFKNINIVKPGFININLNIKEVEKIINKYSKKKNFGIKKKNKKKKIIIDYSSPNIAKEMHIGHLRSTIIGDCLANILEFLGHNVLRINHIGDWGTQFGILIAWIKKKKIENKISNLQILEKNYIKAQKKFLKNKKFNKLSKKYVVKLQNKEHKVLNLWKKIVNLTTEQNQKIYNTLNVKLNHNNIMGESFYQNMLNNIVNDLLKKKIAILNKKAIVIFFKKNKKKIVIIIKKKDGAFLYNTTEIACAKYRYEVLKADEIIYLTDFRQKQHLELIFSILYKAKYIPQHILLKHYYFGVILDKNKKPLKTREGNNVKLKDLIKKAKKHSINLIKNKNNTYKQDKIKKIANKIAIGAIKYSDLSKDRTNNYLFNWNKILSYSGNTGPYIQYAYTRIISILKKNNTNITNAIKYNKFIINNNLEFLIIKKILNFEEIILKSSQNGTPHIICNYLYNITVLFSNFYETNHINNIKNINLKKSKIKFIAIIAKIIKLCLNLLGIPILNKM